MMKAILVALIVAYLAFSVSGQYTTKIVPGTFYEGLVSGVGYILYEMDVPEGTHHFHVDWHDGRNDNEHYVGDAMFFVAAEFPAFRESSHILFYLDDQTTGDYENAPWGKYYIFTKSFGSSGNNTFGFNISLSYCSSGFAADSNDQCVVPRYNLTVGENVTAPIGDNGVTFCWEAIADVSHYVLNVTSTTGSYFDFPYIRTNGYPTQVSNRYVEYASVPEHETFYGAENHWFFVDYPRPQGLICAFARGLGSAGSITVVLQEAVKCNASGPVGQSYTYDGEYHVDQTCIFPLIPITMGTVVNGNFTVYNAYQCTEFYGPIRASFGTEKLNFQLNFTNSQDPDTEIYFSYQAGSLPRAHSVQIQSKVRSGNINYCTPSLLGSCTLTELAPTSDLPYWVAVTANRPGFITFTLQVEEVGELIKKCPGSPVACSGHGTCNVNTGNCTCTDNYSGDDCSIPPPGPSPSSASTTLINLFEFAILALIAALLL